MQGIGEMKIAVPLYHERVAPHFGSAKEVLLVEIEQNRSVRESCCDLSGKSVMAAAPGQGRQPLNPKRKGG